MKKITLLFFLLIFLVGCTSEKEKRKWRNHAKEEVVNGIENPYMVADYIYNYIASDDDIPDSRPTIRCFYQIYTLHQDAKKQDVLLEYLNSLTKNREQNVRIDGQKVATLWMPLSKISSTLLFNPFGEATFRFDMFGECQDFLAVDKPVNETAFFKKFRMRFYEDSSIDEERALQMKHEFSQVVKNEKTLVRIIHYCRSSIALFFDSNRKYFIKLHFNVPEKSQNPACK